MNKIRDAAILIQKLSHSPNKPQAFQSPGSQINHNLQQSRSKISGAAINSEEEATANQLLGTQLKMD